MMQAPKIIHIKYLVAGELPLSPVNIQNKSNWVLVQKCTDANCPSCMILVATLVPIPVTVRWCSLGQPITAMKSLNPQSSALWRYSFPLKRSTSVASGVARQTRPGQKKMPNHNADHLAESWQTMVQTCMETRVVNFRCHPTYSDSFECYIRSQSFPNFQTGEW